MLRAPRGSGAHDVRGGQVRPQRLALRRAAQHAHGGVGARRHAQQQLTQRGAAHLVHLHRSDA